MTLPAGVPTRFAKAGTEFLPTGAVSETMSAVADPRLVPSPNGVADNLFAEVPLLHARAAGPDGAVGTSDRIVGPVPDMRIGSARCTTRPVTDRDGSGIRTAKPPLFEDGRTTRSGR